VCLLVCISDSVTIQIFADNGGTIGSLIDEFTESISLIDTDGARGNTNRKHVDFTNPVSLLANTDYWISMSGGTLASPIELGMLGLRDPNAPQDSSMIFRNGNDPWLDPRPVFGDMAFRLHGAVVPIPPSVWLFGSGLLGLVGMARRKT